MAKHEQLPSDRAFDYEFDDVQAEQIIGWIEWAGIELPVKVTGQLSGWLWAQRSSEGWLDFGNYRVEGEITSPRLGLDQWFVNSARLRFGFAEGNWYVSHLSGEVFQADVKGSLGRVDAAAIIPTEATQILQTSGEIAQVDLRRLLNALNIHVGVSGGGELSFAGSVELGDVTQVERWRAIADLQLNQVDLDDAAFPTAALRAQASLAKGRWEIANGELSWLAQPIRVAGSGRITGDFPYSLGVQGRSIETEQLLRDVELPSLAEQLSGSVSAEADVSGSVTHGIQTAAATIDSNEFVYRGQTLRQLDLRASYRPSGVEVRINSARLAGGQLRGFSRWKSLEQLGQLPSEAEFLLESVRLEELSSELVPVELGGTADGQITLRSVAAANADAAARWGMDAVLQIGDFSVAIDQPQGVPASLPQRVELDETRMLWSKSLESHEVQGSLTSANGAIDLQGKLHLESDAAAAFEHTVFVGYEAAGEMDNFSTWLPPFTNELEPTPTSAQVTGSFTVQGDQTLWLQRAEAEIAEAQVNIGQQRVYVQTALLRITPEEFRLQQFQITDVNGSIAGAAVVRRQPQGTNRINLRTVNLKLAPYADRFLPRPWQDIAGTAAAEIRLSQNASDQSLWTGWQGDAKASLDAVRFRSLPLGQISLTGSLQQDVLTLDLDAQIFGGQASAVGSVPLSAMAAMSGAVALEPPKPSAPLAEQEATQANVTLNNMELSRIPSELLGAALAGRAEGETQIIFTAARSGWSTQGAFNVSELSVAGTRLGDTRLSWNKPEDSSEAEVRFTAQSRFESRLLLRLDSVPGEALRHTRLATYQATGGADKFALNIPVASSQSHPRQLPVQFTGDFQFSGNPRQWLERGSAKLDALTVRADGQTLRLRTAVLDVSPREFRLRRFRLVTARGRVAGSAIYHRQEDGQHVLNLRAVDQYLSDYLPLVPNFDLPLDGAISLEARLTKTANGANWTNGWQGGFASELRQLTFQDQPLGDLSVTGKLKGEALAVEANGTLLGGGFSAAARLPFVVFMNSVENPLQGAFPLGLTGEINGLDVARLAHIAAGPRMAAGLRGFASAEIEANPIDPKELQWSSRISIPSMSNNGELLARNLSASLTYANESLQIEELSGGIAGGRLEARGPLDLSSLIAGRRSQQSAGLRFDIQRVKVANLLRLAFPDYADPFTGILSYRGTARISRGVLLSGDAHVDDASAYGFPIQRVHGDLRLRLNSDGSLGKLSSQNLNGTVLGGNFAGQFGLRGGARYELEAEAKVTRGQLQQLSRALGFDHIVGKGRFEGAAGLQSRDAASLAALTGGVQIDFQGGDAQSVPLLADLARYIPLLQLASTEIRTGTLHALIGQGQLRIRDVLLVGDAFWLVGEGNAGLTSGRLDIDAVLETGSGIDQELVQGAVRNLAVVAIPQLALLVELNDLISNRSLYFHIGGTTRQPAIQARAAQTLARGVIQTVRRRLLAAPLSAATAAETLRD